MTIKGALKKCSTIEIELLLSHILGKPKEFLYMNAGRKLSANQRISLLALVKRRKKGEPIAYILGYKDFCGLRFKVNKDVLIPRPETEWVVHRVIASPAEAILIKKKIASSSVKALTPRNDTKLKILDVGTGSGCIAISLAKLLGSRAQITASDISKKALVVAKQNAKNLLSRFYSHTLLYDSKIKFVQSDLFENVKGEFDVIVANLPYIPLKMLHRYMLHKASLPIDDPFSSLKFEPKFALTDGTSIWLIYKRFFEQVRAHIHPKSVILLEIDPASRKFLSEYQKKYLPDWQIKFHKDFNYLWRYAEVCLE